MDWAFEQSLESRAATMGVVAQPETRDPDLGRLLRLAWRWGWLLALAALAGALAASKAGSSAGTTYRANAVVLVGPIGGDYNTLRAAGQQAQTLSQVADSQPVLTGAQSRLGAAAEGSLVGRVSAIADETTRLVTITATAKTARDAAVAANAVAAELAARQDKANAIAQAALNAGRKTRSAAANRIAADSTVALAAPALPPSAPVKRSSKPLAAIAALAALLLALTVLLIWDFFRGRVAVERDVTDATGLPHLATLRRSRRLLRRESGDGRSAAAGYELLAGRVELARPDKRCRSIVVSGAGRGDRSGDVAANLAAALAAKGSRVILLDADADTRHVTRVLGLEDRAGLGELLTSAGDRPPVADIAVERSRHLRVVALGALEGHQLIDARRAARVLDRVLENADMVVVSAGAAATSAAALAWARCTDGTILLARRNGTRRDELERASEALTEVGTRVLGTALAEPARVRRLKLGVAAMGRRGSRPRMLGGAERPGEASS